LYINQRLFVTIVSSFEYETHVLVNAVNYFCQSIHQITS